MRQPKRTLNSLKQRLLGTRLIEGGALDLLPLEVGHGIHEVEAHAALNTQNEGTVSLTGYTVLVTAL